MAAMSIFINTILNIPKSSHNCHSIVTLHSKISMVCFTSASKHAEGQNACDRNRNNYEVDEAISGLPDDVKMTMDRSNEKSRIMKEKTNAAAELANDREHEKTKENMGSVAAKAQEMKDKAMGSAEKMVDRTKERVEGVWGAAKETGQKMKETVVGESEEDGDLDDYVKDYEKKVERDEKKEKKKKNKY